MPNVVKPSDNQVPGPAKQSTATDSTARAPLMSEDEISGSMKTEEPLGWDQAPKDIADPKQKRHPRPDGEGGVVGDKSDGRASDKI